MSMLDVDADWTLRRVDGKRMGDAPKHVRQVVDVLHVVVLVHGEVDGDTNYRLVCHCRGSLPFSGSLRTDGSLP